MLLAAVALVPVLAAAQPLGDPMRPPAERETAGRTTPEKDPRATADLQGVLLGPTRKLALIEGRVVPLGERLPDERRLLEVTPQFATVGVGQSKQTLPLHPGIAKKKAAP